MAKTTRLRKRQECQRLLIEAELEKHKRRAAFAIEFWQKALLAILLGFSIGSPNLLSSSYGLVAIGLASLSGFFACRAVIWGWNELEKIDKQKAVLTSHQ